MAVCAQDSCSGVPGDKAPSLEALQLVMVDILGELVVGEYAVGTRVTDNANEGLGGVGTLVGVRGTDWHCISNSACIVEADCRTGRIAI